MAVEHSIEVYDSSDNYLAFIDKWKSISYEQVLNKPSNLTFEMDMADPKAINDNLLGGQNYIKYSRGTQLRWGGQITSLGGNLAKDDRPFSVTCGDWVYLLKDKFITTEETWSSINEGTILQEVVNYFQVQSDGSYGITNGVNTSVDPRDRTYVDKNVLDIFTEFSSLQNGLDFEITPDRVLNIYEKKSTDRTGTHVFSYGENIDDFQWAIDFTQLKNDLKVYGADGIIRTRDNVNSQITYKRRQDILSYTDIPLNTTLDRLADEVLQVHANPIRTYSLSVLPDAEPLFGTYEIGDTVQLVIEGQGLLDINQAVRIYGWNVTINEEGYEQLTLQVSTKL